jgi:hypothetical protein
MLGHGMPMNESLSQSCPSQLANLASFFFWPCHVKGTEYVHLCVTSEREKSGNPLHWPELCVRNSQSGIVECPLPLPGRYRCRSIRPDRRDGTARAGCGATLLLVRCIVAGLEWLRSLRYHQHSPKMPWNTLYAHTLCSGAADRRPARPIHTPPRAAKSTPAG